VGGTEKLVPNLNNKEKYVVHLKTLQLYISLGLKVTKIHRALSFTQAAWMKPYIEKNTQMRTKADNEFEKDFYKLMNNSVFGRTMMNVRKFTNFELVTNLKRLKKIQTAPKGKIKSTTIYRTCDNCLKPNYEELECLGCLVGVHREKPQVKLDICGYDCFGSKQTFDV
jgi:hypothetical protein